MGCAPCGRKKKAKMEYQPFTVMGGYANLNTTQITKRLETFKKLWCKKCEKKEQCDFAMYKACQESKGKPL